MRSKRHHRGAQEKNMQQTVNRALYKQTEYIELKSFPLKTQHTPYSSDTLIEVYQRNKDIEPSRVRRQWIFVLQAQSKIVKYNDENSRRGSSN
jgi:GH25 family lysozyme M1 (1,4-beta-N-acetylmuramidase)